MNDNRYNELSKDLNPSLEMKLNAIRMNLHDGKASCLVGAGFSKNAEMDEATHMKDWFELADDLYKALYGEEPRDENVRYKSVMRLASQVNASRGRAVLESLIENSLPDERVSPGSLHINLMKLPWNDVFTTNYDTLLEKAFINADRYYHLVTNKETLLYAPHPRLIKLHGSFPNVRPYIITEEDYRTYPKKFPEFVNTVRQSLIENVLCLIGFSGDDPNFLNWVGWLRDIMGKQAAPVYHITYNTQMHDSNIHLSRDMGIDIINLADIKNIKGFSEALDFFLTYINKKDTPKWRGEIPHRTTSLSSKESYDVQKFVKDLKEIRESYPGWIVPPVSYLRNFSDTRLEIPYWNALYAKCADMSAQIDFLYEVNWRIETALAPADLDWYLLALEELSFEHSQYTNNKTYQKAISLKLSLLNIYRIKGTEENYTRILKTLEQLQQYFTYEHGRQLSYIKCLFYISILDYSSIQQVINNWSLQSMDYQGHLWKSGVLIEIGQLQEAKVMLLDLLKLVKRNILISKYSVQLSSIRSTIELFLWRLDPEYSVDSKKLDFNFKEIIRFFKDEIVKEENMPSYYRSTNGFNLLSKNQSWTIGEKGLKKDFWGTFCYFKLYEKLGFPFGIPQQFSSDIEVKTYMIERLIQYNPKYALQWMLRCCSQKVINTITRKALLHITREDACIFFDQNISTCEIALSPQAQPSLQTRVLKCLIPILVKLSVLISPDRMERLFNVVCTVYRLYPRSYEGDYVITLYNNLSGKELNNCQKIALQQPIIPSANTGRDFETPTLWISEIEYSEEAGNIAMAGLSSTDKNIQEAAYKRISILRKTKLSNSTTLNKSIENWRKQKTLSDVQFISLFEFPAKEKDMISIANSELKSFLSIDSKYKYSSNQIDNLLNKLFRLQIGYSLFSETQHVSFLKKVTEILEQNEDTFKIDDSESYLGGLRSYTQNIFPYLDYYGKAEGLPQKNHKIWKPFKTIIERYMTYGYPVLTIMVHLSYLDIWKKKQTKRHVENALLSDSEILIKDASNALVIMAKKQGARVNQTIIKNMISKISYVLDDNTHIYLYTIKNILLNKGLGNEAHIMLEEWLSNLPNRIENYSIAEEIKDDIRYYANLIVGIISKVRPNWIGLEDWKSYMNKDHIKNDVRNGFQMGICLYNQQ